MTKEERQGRNLLLFVFVLAVVADVFLTIILWHGKLFDEMWRSLGRNCLTIGFIYVIWRGVIWARWLMVAMMFFAGFTSISFVVSRFLPWFVFTAAAFFTAGCILAFSKRITAFLTFQQRRNENPYT